MTGASLSEADLSGPSAEGAKAAPLPRRPVLALPLSFLALSVLPRHAHAAWRPQTQTAIDRIRAGRPLRDARVTLRMPPIAENGNTVPLTVTVDSPMTAANHVKAVHVLADRNPLAEVATFHLSPALGRAEVSTRIRLAETQGVLAIAELSDGSLLSGEVTVTVTIGGCTG